MAREAIDRIPLGKSDVRRLHLWHLMLWMALSCAFYLLFAAEEGRESLQDLQLRLLLLSYGIAAGGELTGAIELVYARVRLGKGLVEHPGHWLLLISAALW